MQKDMENSPKFTAEYTVPDYMTDMCGYCRAADTVRIFLEAAIRQLEVCGPDAETMKKRGLAFILVRASYDFPEPLLMDDRVKAATWWRERKNGYTFDRGYTLSVERDGEVRCAARGVSQWVVWDINTHQLMDTAAFGDFPAHSEAVDTVLPQRFRIPQDTAMEKVGEKTVRYSDTDKNGHLNNTRYIDLFADFMPCLTEGCRMTAVSVSYMKEAPLGEVLDVYRAQADKDTVYFRTVRQSDGAVNAEAVVKTEFAETV